MKELLDIKHTDDLIIRLLWQGTLKYEFSNVYIV